VGAQFAIGVTHEDSGVTFGVHKGPIDGTIKLGGNIVRGGTLPFRFTIDFDVSKAPPTKKSDPPKIAAPLPKLKPSLAVLMLDMQNCDPKLTSKAKDKLEIWIKTIQDAGDPPGELLNVIKEGNVPIEVETFASVSDDNKANDKLATDRLREIEKLLTAKPNFGPKVKIKGKPNGVKKPPKKKPDSADNRADITFELGPAIVEIVKLREKYGRTYL
jgi:hypothetical protein